MADSDGIKFVIEDGDTCYTRVYHRSDAKEGIIIIGRLSSTSPGDAAPSEDPVDGQIVSKGMAAFTCPVMSRQHARLVFGEGGQVFLSDPPDHSHHGTWITRGEETFKVGHPQLLQSGDRIVFGKSVHRAGEIYNPLTVRVQLLSAGSPSTSHVNSFTGKGYALPADIDNESSGDDDIEVLESRSTHKHYAVEEILTDDDDHLSDVCEVPAPTSQPQPQSLQPPPRRVLPFSTIAPPVWTVPKLVSPSQVSIQPRQPSPPMYVSGFGLNDMSMATPPWRRFLGLEGLTLPPITPSGVLQKERERDRTVALSVLQAVEDELARNDQAQEHNHEVIDVDALGTPDFERAESVIFDKLVPAMTSPEIPVAGLDDDDSSSDMDESSADDVDVDADADADAEVHIMAVDDIPLPSHDRSPSFSSERYNSPQTNVSVELAPNTPPPVQDSEDLDLDGVLEAVEHYKRYKKVHESINDLSNKIELLQGSRNRSKRRFNLFKGDVDVKLEKLDTKCLSLEEEQELLTEKEGQNKAEFEQSITERVEAAIKEAKDTQASMTTRKEEFVQEVQALLKQTETAVDTKVDALKASLEATRGAMTEARQALESLKRKRDEETEQASPVTSAPLVAPDSQLIDTRPSRSIKRRRFSRVAGSALAGVTLAYVGLGMLWQP